jgi:hypothetical protein
VIQNNLPGKSSCIPIAPAPNKILVNKKTKDDRNLDANAIQDVSHPYVLGSKRFEHSNGENNIKSGCYRAINEKGH